MKSSSRFCGSILSPFRQGGKKTMGLSLKNGNSPAHSQLNQLSVPNEGNHKNDLQNSSITPENGPSKHDLPSDNSSSTSIGCDTDDIIRLNISGGYFEVTLTTLSRYSDTLLGSENDLRKYYLEDRNEYFFERNRLIFSAILYFYQSQGKFYRPTCVTEEQFSEEIRFFKLEDHYEKYVENMDDEDKDSISDADKTFLRKCWDFFEEPDSSKAARVWAILDVLAITLAVALFIVETMPEIKKAIDSKEPNSQKTTFKIIETVCIMFFTIELIARFICCPDKFLFIKTAMNWIDLVTVLPFFIQFMTAENKGGEALVVLRVLRVIRVLKLARHSKGIVIVTKTLAASVNELALLLFFWFIGVIIFGSIMYYLEFKEDLVGSADESKFRSILESSWWAVVTMSTVGYGDMVPLTPFGKLIASICMMFSMIVIALPVTVIVSKFTRVYAKYKDKL
ncbi:potassium voltage-gated channel subfamily A member 1-like isoform X2 [Bolinopsis microptera]|uniref:potassium voltage-gated channel subfamily A member 1-like isoform X2 n=1 Tax=Bolinopsis microptera TaxID=2820187 RepID=UPI003079F0E8